MIIIQGISLRGRDPETKGSLQNEVIMPPRQTGGISHKIMYIAHQVLDGCLTHDNVVIYADSFLHPELRTFLSPHSRGQFPSKFTPGPGTSRALTAWLPVCNEFSEIKRKQLEMFIDSWHCRDKIYCISQKYYWSAKDWK